MGTAIGVNTCEVIIMNYVNVKVKGQFSDVSVIDDVELEPVVGGKLYKEFNKYDQWFEARLGWSRDWDKLDAADRRTALLVKAVRRYGHQWGKQSNVDHFMRDAYRELNTRDEVDLFVSASNLVRGADAIGLDDRAFSVVLWRRYRLAVVRRLPLKDGSGTATIQELFLKGLRNIVDDSYTDEQLEFAFWAWLAYTARGVAGEYSVFRLLCSFYGDAVQRGSSEEDHEDVDILLFGSPVSIKCYNAFRASRFDYYRGVKKNTRPVVYVGFAHGSKEVLDVAVPDDKYKSGYRFGGVALLEDMVVPDEHRTISRRSMIDAYADKIKKYKPNK